MLQTDYILYKTLKNEVNHLRLIVRFLSSATRHEKRPHQSETTYISFVMILN